ncbi:MAG: glycosyltransferase family 9 protein [Ignavibacteria bacterium]|nr:glycosyltransferase family 9 protein [Ignavibacteria bacterium]
MSDRILVIHTSFLGDAILALPFIQELAKVYAGHAIDVITSPRGKDIFAASPYVTRVLVLDKRGEHRSLLKSIKFARALRNEGYGKVYSLHRSFRTALLVWALKIPVSLGFDTSAAAFVYTRKVAYHKNWHEVARNLAFLDETKYEENWKIQPEIISAGFRTLVDEILSGLNIQPGFIAIAPGSVWQTKRYPQEHFLTLIRKFQTNGFTIVLLGGKDEEKTCDWLSDQTDCVTLAGKLPIVAVKELLERAALLITNDSGLTHLGMSAACRVLTIYCSTIPEFGFYPYSPHSAYIGKIDIPCKPCGIHGHKACPEKHFACGYQLMPDDVYTSAEALLRKGNNGN